MDSAKLLNDFEKAITNLEEAMNIPAEKDVVRAGCIQYFEFCFELAWKSIKISANEQGFDDCNSPKSCLKRAFSNNWIQNEDVWLEMLAVRNRMSHTYDAAQALTVYHSLSLFIPEFRILHSALAKSCNS